MRAWVLAAWWLAGDCFVAPHEAPWVAPRLCSVADALKPPLVSYGVAPRYVPSSPAPTVTVGTAHPVAVVATSPDARWTAFLQARADTDGDGMIRVEAGYHGSFFGDQMALYLARGGGPGEAIDGFLTGSPEGRYVAVVRGGAVHLLDTVADTDAVLPDADPTRGDDPSRCHRGLSFDAAAARVVWIRTTSCGPLVMVRTLRDGRERALVPGPGELSDAWIDEAGHWVLARTVTRDTNGDGRLDARDPDDSRFVPRCADPPDLAGFRRATGDVSEVSAAPAAGGTMQPMPGFLAVVGRYLLQRRADDAITARSPDGAVAVWAEPACHGELVARARDVERVLVACRPSATLTLSGPATRCALPLRGPLHYRDARVVDREMSVDRGNGTRARVDLVDAVVDSPRFVPSTIRPTLWARSYTPYGGVFEYQHLWIDFTTRTCASMRDDFMAVDVDGRVLRAAIPSHAEPFHVPRGPLVWSRPPDPAHYGEPPR